MGLPPKGDPQRPLALAIRSTRLLGGVLILFSLVMLIPAVRLFRSAGTGTIRLALLTTITVFYAGPGVLYLVCSIFMKRRKTWAVVVSLVLASLHLLMTVFVGLVLLGNIFVGPGQGRILLAPSSIVLIFIAAFVQLIVHLSRSLAAIRVDPIGGERGFTPILVQPLINQPDAEYPNQHGG